MPHEAQSHGRGLAGGHAADVAETHQAHRLARDLATLGEHLARPAAGGHGGRGPVRRTTQQDHRHRQHVFRDRLGIRARGRYHLYPARGTRREVDVVEPDAQPAHDAKPPGAGQRLTANLRPVAHDPRIGIAERRRESRRIVDERRSVVHVEVARQERHGGRIHVLGNDDSWHG